MHVLVKHTCISAVLLLLSSVTLGVRFYESHKHRSLPVKRVISNVLESKRGQLYFKNEAPPPITIVNTGEQVTFECEAGGSPPPTIHWLKDGERIEQGEYDNSIEDDSTFENQLEEPHQRLLRVGLTKSKLFLRCPSQTSQGKYTCVAETPYRRISRSSQLEIGNVPNNVPLTLENERCLIKRSMKDGEPARVYLWTANRLEMENADVQLFCRATGYPRPVITWVDPNGSLIQKGDKNYKILDNGDLLIYNINWEDDFGVYNCIATNPTGTDKVETFLYPTSP